MSAATPLSANERFADCPQEFITLVTAVSDSRVHIVSTDSGYHVHFGDRASINTRACDSSLNGISFANCGMFNSSNKVLEARGVKIPLDIEKIRQAITYMQSVGIMPAADPKH